MLMGLARRLGSAMGQGGAPFDAETSTVFAEAFPLLDSGAQAQLFGHGATHAVASRMLVSEIDDPSPRIVLLVAGNVTVDRMHHADIEVPSGIAWNELTWASRGRVNGGRLHAGPEGARLVEWSGKRLHRLALDLPALYGALNDAVMRCAGLHHTLQLERARVVQAPILRREPALTLGEIIAAAPDATKTKTRTAA